MPKELQRQQSGDKIIITYDDGSTKQLDYEQVVPATVVDADGITSESGHTFTDEELKTRGYQQ